MNAGVRHWGWGLLLGACWLGSACGEPAREGTRGRAEERAPAYSSVCGDGVLEGMEVCDDGNNVLESCVYGERSCNVCDPGCRIIPGQTSFCGDGVQDSTAGELCDDGNTQKEVCAYGESVCTVCDASCRLQAGETSYCGDGALDTLNGEICDDGFIDGCGTCNNDCSGAGEEPVCGDSRVCAELETCDDGNMVEGDGCDSTCQVSGCGSGVVTEGEVCDDGNREPFDSCSADCARETLVEEFQACTSYGDYQGDCRGHTHCVPWEETNTCLKPCAGPGDTATCGVNGCGGISFGTNDTRYYCLPRTATRDEPCRDNLKLCAPGEGTCLSTEYRTGEGPVNFRCKVACDGGSIGSQGSCGEGELCARNSASYADIQRVNGQNVPCVGDDASGCAPGHACLGFSGGARYCAKWVGWCGSVTPLCGRLDYTGIARCVSESPCDDREDHKICGITTAEGTPADTMCFKFGLGPVCVGVCDAGEESLDCGEGFLCRIPPAVERFYYNLEANGAVPCQSSDDCLEGNDCKYFNQGPRCGRPLRLCYSEALEGESCDFLEDGSDTCAAGLACLSGNGTDFSCLKPCAGPEDSACGEKACEGVSLGTDVESFYCLERSAARDGLCRENLQACQETEACVPLFSNFVDGIPDEYRCKTLCDVSQIGNQGACPEGEVCFVAPAGALGADPTAWCGESIPLCDRSDAEGVAACLALGECDGVGAHRFCGLGEDAAGISLAELHCVQGEGGSLCRAMCESEAGDLSCGPQRVCRAPIGAQADLFQVQGDGPAACVGGTECDQVSGYGCYEVHGSMKCARPRRICMDKDPVCGDGFVAGVETCDDGNRADGDGCDSNCTPTGCGNGVRTGEEACDTGGDSFGCDSDCSAAVCGDGYLNIAHGEACDDIGNTAACDLDCTVPLCGDGITNRSAGERCDGGNIDAAEVCPDPCDAIVLSPETSFRDQGLRDWDFSGLDLSGRDFADADLAGADFSGAILRGADLSGCNLLGANLSGADLSETNLVGASMTGAYLTSADLSGANLTNAELSGTTRTDAVWSNATCPDGESAEGADPICQPQPEEG